MVAGAVRKIGYYHLPFSCGRIGLASLSKTGCSVFDGKQNGLQELSFQSYFYVYLIIMIILLFTIKDALSQ